MSTLPTLRQMLENGVHFGHVKSRWNPKMKPYIYAARDNVYVINLEQTRIQLEEALKFIQNIVAHGGSVLFVGTKRQAKPLIIEAAKRCGMPFIAERWFGGTLTNMPVLKQNIRTLKTIEEAEEKGAYDHLTKKERLKIDEKKSRLQLLLEGVRDMQHMPNVVFVVDSGHEEIAVSEARSLNIPVVALIDTNANPTLIDYPIPANDDATKSIRLIVDTIADAIINARVKAPEVKEVTLVEDEAEQGEQK